MRMFEKEEPKAMSPCMLCQSFCVEVTLTPVLVPVRLPLKPPLAAITVEATV
jgi:hypothetical protein